MGAVKYWILWLLLWQVASAKDLRCGPVLADVAAGSALKASRLIMHNEQMPTDPHGALEPSLHSYIYNGDFPGFSKHLRMLSQHDNFPSLLGALQAGDDRGMTVAHLLACAGRQHELSQLMDVLFRMQGDGVEMIRRIVLESRNQDACKGTNCDYLEDRPGLYAHGTLHINDPPQQVVLFGDVTPLECAAAHGHVQTMKVLIQGGVSAGKAFDVAKVFSLTNHFHQAIQLANEEGFLAQPKVFLPPSSTNKPHRQPRLRRNSSASGTQSTARNKVSGASKHGHAVISQQTGIVENALTAVLMESSSSSSGFSSSSSGDGGAVGDSTGTDGDTAQKVTKLSDMLDIAALLLLTGMLLLPLWSTICLLWRRAVRRRAAVTEPARRIKQAMIAATSSTSTNASSNGSTSETAPAVTSTKKCKASPSSTGKQRKGRPIQPSPGGSTGTSTKVTVAIPVSLNADAHDADGTLALILPKQQSPGTSPAAAAVRPVDAHSSSRSMPAASPVVVSKCGIAHLSDVPDTSNRSLDSAEYGRSNALASAKQKCAGQQGSTSPSRPSTASTATCPSPVVMPPVPVPISRSSSCSSSSLLGPATPADAVMDVPAAAAANITDVRSTCGIFSSKDEFGAVEYCEEEFAATTDAAEPCRAAGTPVAAVPSSGGSKRRVAGSRAVGAAATAASATSPRSAAPTNDLDQQACLAVRPKQQHMASSNPGQRLVKGKQKGSKGAGTAVCHSTKASNSTNASVAQVEPQRTVSAGATLRDHHPMVVAPPELRALSADDAAQTAKAYASLIAPYSPSAGAAAARPAIYQPPGALGTQEAGADVVGAGTPASNSRCRPLCQQQNDANCNRDAGAFDDVAAHKNDQCKEQPSYASPGKAATAKEASTAQALQRGATASGAAVHMPAAVVELGSAAGLPAAGNSVISCFSEPPVLAPSASSSSSSINGEIMCRDAQMLCDSFGLQVANSSPQESSLSSCSSYEPPAARNVAGAITSNGTVVRKLSDAASVHSDAGCLMPGIVNSNTTGVNANSNNTAGRPAALGLSSMVTDASPRATSAGQSPHGQDHQRLAAATATGGAAGSGSPAPATAAWHAQQLLPSVSRTVSGPPGSLSPVQHADPTLGPYRPLDRSLSASAASVGVQLPQPSMTVDADASAAARAPHEACLAFNSHSPVSAAASGNDDVAAVLGSRDVVVAGPPRSSGSTPSADNLRHNLASQMGLSMPVQHHQQQQQLSPNMQALAAQLLQQPVQGSPNFAGHSVSPQVNVSPQMVAQMANRWQQQQQHQAMVRAPQQQQWVASSMEQVPGSQQQQVQAMLQPPPSTCAGGNPAPVQLPAGMLALMQASSSHAALLQQQQQQARQQQQLRVFVPQQSGVQLSPSGAALNTLSPQQRAMLFSPGSGVPAVSLPQQSQQSTAVSTASIAQQVAYLQQQQPVQLMQLHGALQGGAIRVFQPASVAAAAGQQITQVPLAAAAAGVRQGAGQAALLSPTGPGTAFVAGQRLTTAGQLSPAGITPAITSTGMTAAAFAAMTSNTASSQLNAAQRGNTISASQQLLAMVPGLSQARQQQQGQQGHVAVNKFDWSTLASDLTGRHVGPASAGAVYDLAAIGGAAVAIPDPPGLVSCNMRQPASGSVGASPQAALAAMAAAAGAAGMKRDGRLSIAVPDASQSSPDASQHNESARMAAELDELLQQANQQLGWSSIPSAADASTPGDSNKAALASPAAAVAVASPSTLKPDAPEYQPKGSVGIQAKTPCSARCSVETAAGGSNTSESNHLRSLEALQLPDGFCSGD